MANFDYAGAKAAGASDSQIAEFLAERDGFDIAGARGAGADDEQIIGFLTKKPGLLASAVSSLRDVGKAIKSPNPGTTFSEGLDAPERAPGTISAPGSVMDGFVPQDQANVASRETGGMPLRVDYVEKTKSQLRANPALAQKAAKLDTPIGNIARGVVAQTESRTLGKKTSLSADRLAPSTLPTTRDDVLADVEQGTLPQFEQSGAGQLSDALVAGAKEAYYGAKATGNAYFGNSKDLGQAIADAVSAGRNIQQTAADLRFENKLKAVGDTGFFETLSKLPEYASIFSEEPLAAAKSIARSLPNAAVTLPVTLAGRAVGGLLGAAAGAPTGPLALVSGAAGAVALGAVANTILETGPAIRDAINAKTNGAAETMSAEDLAKYISQHPEVISEARATGVKRGLTIGAIEGLVTLGAGRLVSAPERAAADAARAALGKAGVDAADAAAVKAALQVPENQLAVKLAADNAADQFSKAGRAARWAGAGAAETLGSGAGEAGAQYAAGQPYSGSDVIMEMAGELGGSPVTTAASKAVEVGLSGYHGLASPPRITPEQQTADITDPSKTLDQAIATAKAATELDATGATHAEAVMKNVADYQAQAELDAAVSRTGAGLVTESSLPLVGQEAPAIEAQSIVTGQEAPAVEPQQIASLEPRLTPYQEQLKALSTPVSQRTPFQIAILRYPSNSPEVSLLVEQQNSKANVEPNNGIVEPVDISKPLTVEQQKLADNEEGRYSTDRSPKGGQIFAEDSPVFPDETATTAPLPGATQATAQGETTNAAFDASVEAQQATQERRAEQQPADAVANPHFTGAGAAAPHVAALLKTGEGVQVHTIDDINSLPTATAALTGKRMSRHTAKAIRGLMSVFGRKVVFYEASQQTHEGVMHDGKTIYVNADGGVDAMAVAGHEFTHTLRHTHPELYEKAHSAVVSLLKSDPDRASRYAKYLNNPDISTENSDELAHELLADIGGNESRTGQFWGDVFDQIHAEHPHTAARAIVTKLRDALVTFINKLIAATPKQGFEHGFGREELTDIREHLVTAAREAFVRNERQRLGLPPLARDQGREGVRYSAAKNEDVKPVSTKVVTLAPGKPKGVPTVVFEVAPDPNNEALTAQWNELTEAKRYEISEATAEKFVPQILAKHGATGKFVVGTGSYGEFTNPSFALELDDGSKAVEVGASAGVVFTQDGMLPVSDKAESWAVKGWQLTVELPKGADPAYIDKVYQLLHAVRLPDGSQPVQGQSTSRDGVMAVKNIPEWGGVEHDKFETEVYPLLAKALDGSGLNLLYHLDYSFYKTLSNGEDYYHARRLERSETGTEGTSGRPSRQGWRGVLQESVRSQLAEAIADARQTRHSPERRPDGAGSAADGRRAGADVQGQESRPGAVSATGVHYSKQERSVLDSSYFGTGLKGAEIPRLEESKDSRIKHRIYFYTNSGKGIKPEGGVGIHAHTAQLDNLYDANNDSLDLWASRRGNAFEIAVLDHGFDGYVNHDDGIAVLLGQRTVPVEYIGTNDRPQVEKAGASEKSTYGKLQQAIEENRSLPAGEMTGEDWKRMMPKLMPEIDVSHLQDDKPYYKDQLVERPRLSPARTYGKTGDAPTDFVTVDESVRFGEITGAQSKAMRRQAGSIRLPIGEQRADGTGYGLAHIRANHGKQILNAGFRSVEDFVLHVAGDFGQIWKADGMQLLAAVRDGKQHMMYVQLEPAKDASGEYYRVNAAFPVRQEDYPERHGFKMLWDGSEPTSVAAGQQPAFASQAEDVSGQPTPNARGQSENNVPPEDGGRKFSPPRFFSQLATQIDKVPARLAVQPATQWKLWIASNAAKLGIKKDEIFWSGLDDYLALRGREKVSKDEIAQFLAENGTKVNDVILGHQGEDGWRNRLDELNNMFAYQMTPELKKELQALRERAGPDADSPPPEAKFSQYVVPGGENYRELLVTLPKTDGVKALSAASDGDTWEVKMADGSTISFPTRMADDKSEAYSYAENQRGTHFQSSHFDQANILVHLRMDERTDADGERVLFLQELQSDWQQAKRGGKEVPEGPFVTDTKSWVALGIKRAIMYAVQHGMTKVAWANGEQNAGHYDLSKQISAIRYNKVGGEYGVVAIGRTDSRNSGIVMERAVPESGLEEIVGKELAQKIINGEGTPGKTELNNGDVIDTKSFSGLDLKVGGEGMKAFYDQILPQVANDVLKKLGGGRVEMVELVRPNASRRDEILAEIEAEEGGQRPRTSRLQQQGFTITPTMAEKVATEGVPLFSASRIIGDSGRQYTPEQQQLHKQTGREINPQTTLEKLREWVGQRWVQGVVDQFAPIKDLDGTAYRLTRQSKGATGAFEAFMHYGKLSLEDGTYNADTTGGVLGTVFAPIGKETTDFLYWVAGNRAERLAAEGKERLFSPANIAAAQSLADGTTDFDYVLPSGQATRDRTRIYRDTLRKFNEFNANVMDMAEQSGLIDGASRHLWEHEFYVPFYRVTDDKDGSVRGMNIKKGIVRQTAFKKLKGGTDGLNDLLSNTLMNWAHLIDASAKNRAAKATLDVAENLGAAQRVASSMAEYAAANGALLHPDTKNTVWYTDKGEPVKFVVEDKALLTAIGSLDYVGLRGPMWSILSAPKHWLTMGVTASPFFKIRNLIRDSVQAIGTSGLGYNVFSNLTEGWALTHHDRPEYASALAGGGLIRFGTMLEGNEAKRTRRLIAKGASAEHILDSDSKLRAFWDRFGAPTLDAYNEVGNRSEEINRMALYNQLRAKGVSHGEAAFQARDLMDFGMQGSFDSIRILTQVVPFMNARLQGMYKLGKAANEDKAKFAIVLGAVTLASLGLLAAYHDDDDWKKREDWDRDNYWWFKVDDTAFRIPKPFEIGAMATLAERSAELMFNDEMNGARYRKVVGELLSNQLSMNPIPQMAKPIIDLYANKDSFSGRPIESMGMERLDPEYRFTSSTSMPARGLSTAIGGALSPVQVDHLVRGYFSWLGAFTVGFADLAVRAVNDEPSKPTMDYWKFATGGMAASLDGASSRYVSQVYEQAKELESAYGTYQMLRKTGKLEEAEGYRADNLAKLQKYGSVEAVKRDESKLNARIRLIERSAMDPDIKRDKIREIQKQKDQVARRVNF